VTAALPLAVAPAESIGTRIRAARFRASLTQSELGQAAGITKAAVSAIETGHVTPTIGTLLAFCERLLVTPNDLLSQADLNELDRRLGSQAALRGEEAIVAGDKSLPLLVARAGG